MTENKKVTEKDIIAFIVIISIIALGFFIYANFIPKPLFKEKPISIEAIEITGQEGLFDVSQVLSALSGNIEIKSRTLDYNSEEAKSLIETYNIKTVPALILKSKRINEIGIDTSTFTINNNAAVFDKSVPYLELSSGEIKGKVELIEVYDPNCKDCASLSQYEKQFESLGIMVKNYNAIEYSSDQGKQLVEENSLTFSPSLLMSKEIEEYWWIFPQVKNALTETDKYYVLKDPASPYKDLSTGKVKGIVDIIYLTDKSCEDCFDITNLKQSFQSLGVFIDNEKTIDISSSEGKNLIKKYSITKVPTVILSKELSTDYLQIKNVLEQVGTFEADSSYVFRELDQLNAKYKEI